MAASRTTVSSICKMHKPEPERRSTGTTLRDDPWTLPIVAGQWGRGAALPREPDDEDWSEPNIFRGLVYVPSSKPTRRVIFTSKPQAFSHFVLGDLPLAEDISLLGRYGCLTVGHAKLLADARALECSEGSVLFVGDLDPFDLTAFLSLRAAFPSVKFEFLPADSWLLAAADHLAKPYAASHPIWERLPTIVMSAFERAHWTELERAADMQPIAGAVGVSMLRAGYKLELEGATNPAFYVSAWPGWLRETLLGSSVRPL